MKLLAGYSPIVVGVVLLVAALAFGLWYTRPTENFTNVRIMEGFNQEQKNAACKTLDEQIQLYRAELQKPPASEEMKKLHDQMSGSIKQLDDAKKQYGC